MFGMGLAEIAVIMFIGVLVFGPDRLPDLARQAAGFIRRARSFSASTRDELREQLGPEFADLDLKDLDPRTFIRKQIEEAMAELDEEDQRKVRDSLRASDDADADSSEGSSRSRRRRNRPLVDGELPPYDADAT